MECSGSRTPQQQRHVLRMLHASGREGEPSRILAWAGITLSHCDSDIMLFIMLRCSREARRCLGCRGGRLEAAGEMMQEQLRRDVKTFKHQPRDRTLQQFTTTTPTHTFRPRYSTDNSFTVIKAHQPQHARKLVISLLYQDCCSADNAPNCHLLRRRGSRLHANNIKFRLLEHARSASQTTVLYSTLKRWCWCEAVE